MNKNYINYYQHVITWTPTSVCGLLSVPRFNDSNLNKSDRVNDNRCIYPTNQHVASLGGSSQFSLCNSTILAEQIKRAKPDSLFVEIGTASDFHLSSTDTFFRNKHLQTTFYTFDKTAKFPPGIQDVPLASAYQCVSTDQKVKQILDNRKIDILFIDGDHSIESVFDEYNFYLEHFYDQTIVVIHDTTAHPGPLLLYQALDPKVWDKQICCENDFGIAVAKIRC